MPPVHPVRHPIPHPDVESRIREEAENRPGVYHFLGGDGEIIYVGKAVRLRTRLLSWLRARDGKPFELLGAARGVGWEYVASEFDALVREFRLIRSLRPRFNRTHRRDRRFAWIRLTDGPAPRLIVTRRPGAMSTRRGAFGNDRLFGPLPAHRYLPRLVDDLAIEVGIRDCPSRTPIHFADQLDLWTAPEKDSANVLESAPGAPTADTLPPRVAHCSRVTFGSCPGPCAARCTEDAYARRMDDAVAFLEGRGDALLDRIRHRMEEAAGRSAFETAARARDRLDGLTSLRKMLREVGALAAPLTFVYRTGAGGPGCGSELDEGENRTEADGAEPRHHLVRGGSLLVTFEPPPPEDPGTRARTLAMLRDALDTPAPSPTRLGGDAREERLLVTRWFQARPEELERTIPIPDYLRNLEGG